MAEKCEKYLRSTAKYFTERKIPQNKAEYVDNLTEKLETFTINLMKSNQSGKISADDPLYGLFALIYTVKEGIGKVDDNLEGMTNCVDALKEKVETIQMKLSHQDSLNY